MIILEKVLHRGMHRIGLRFDRQEEYLSKIRTLPDCKWSRTRRIWHIPYEKSSYNAFIQLDLPYQLITTGTTDEPSSKSVPTGIVPKKERNIVPPAMQGSSQDTIIEPAKMGFEIEWTGNNFRLKILYSEANVLFLKSLKGSFWHDGHRIWIIRASIENLEALQNYFSAFDKVSYLKVYEQVSLRHDPNLVTLYQTPQHSNMVMIKIQGFTSDVSIIKSINGRRYDKVYKRWMIDNDIHKVRMVIDRYKSAGHKIINRLSSNAKPIRSKKSKQAYKTHLLKRIKPALVPFINTYVDVMIRLGYGLKTITSYSGKMVCLLEHFGLVNMQEISAEKVNEYLVSIANDDKSKATLNMVYSAVLIYAKHQVYDRPFEIQKLDRPRKSTYLPAILSVQEVDRILKNIQNLKHLTILYTIYGGGLRIGEVLNLRIRDIHWDRNQVLIKSGKGDKERMVMLSQVLKELLEKYFAEYRPMVLLFEGAKEGTKYSESSVRAILKRAVSKAKITKRVTPHILRHSFATHLMDKGIDSRFIQELLGHSNIKTTLRYLHVTNRKISEIQSPLDDLYGGDGEGKS